ncbi:MAG TPA: hypothetical protein VMM77_11520 [Gemmatimonadaceae bacterium]|nr:hypothetical protein [Gemmatimonadaceae bacterium]
MKFVAMESAARPGTMRQLHLAALCTTLTIGPVAAGAQEFAGFGGVEPRFGIVWPRDATSGPGWSLDADLGYLRTPRVRAIVGMSGFSANVDRRVGGAPLGGTLSAFGLHGALRLDPVRTGRLSPFLAALLTLHNVNAEVSDPGVGELLDGVYAGIGFGAGLAYALDSPARFALTAEVRRVFATNVGHGSLLFGIRWMPRGNRAADPGVGQ